MARSLPTVFSCLRCMTSLEDLDVEAGQLVTKRFKHRQEILLSHCPRRRLHRLLVLQEDTLVQPSQWFRLKLNISDWPTCHSVSFGSCKWFSNSIKAKPGSDVLNKPHHYAVLLVKNSQVTWEHSIRVLNCIIA